MTKTSTSWYATHNFQEAECRKKKIIFKETRKHIAVTLIKSHLTYTEKKKEAFFKSARIISYLSSSHFPRPSGSFSDKKYGPYICSDTTFIEYQE